MAKTKLSSKGQIILPKSIRSSRQWEPGTEFAVEEVGDGVLLKPVKAFKPMRLKDVIGCTGYSGPARSIKDMDDAVAKGAKGRR